MEYILSLIIGLFSGFVSSYLFLYLYIQKKKPKIEISEHICKKEVDGKMNYFFKYVNKTGKELFDIRVELKIYKPFGDTKGQNLKAVDIELADDYFQYMQEEKKEDRFNLHAMRVRTEADLDKEMEDPSSFLGLTISARHSLSGLPKVFSQEFHSKDLITMKHFQSGNSLDVG